MGKRRQRTKWCSVEWSQDNQTSTPSHENKEDLVVNRSSNKDWTNSLGPRFWKKATAAEKHVLYEEDIYETKELQNGFTKISSKNLDILFKRDYYEQKKTPVIEEPKECTEDCFIEKIEENDFEGGKGDQTDNTSQSEKTGDNMSECNTSLRSSFDQINLSDIQEFQPMNSFESFPAMTCYPYSSSYQYQDLDSPQPCLYLYSPSDNSLIPCEEITIPNHGMSPEYSGTTNIYLAYSDGRGYITHQYTPSSSYMSQDSAYSTTPQDSGPTSPPTLANLHPSNTDMLVKDTRGDALEHETTTAQETIQHIPGLVFKEDKTQKKSMKKRRKKIKEKSISKDTSTRQDSDLYKSDYQITNGTPSCDCAVSEEDEPIHEIYLTDDLANSLVNPPTDTESYEDVAVGEYSEVGLDWPISDTATESCEDKEHAKSTVVNEFSLNTFDIPPEIEAPSVADGGRDISKSKLNETTKNVIDDKINLCNELVEPKSGDALQSKALERNSITGKHELTLPLEKVEDISSSIASVEKSYSSVVKSSYEEPTNHSESLFVSSTLPISNQASRDIVPENDSDNFEDKTAVTSHDSWIRRTVKRRKPKNRVINHEETPVKDVVIESESRTCTEEFVNIVEGSKEVVTDEINNNEGVKKKHRKKKKTSSEDLDSRSFVRKILIRDDQVEIYSQPLLRETSLLTTSLEMLKFSGYNNCLIISELGSGISRGSMNYGRLYQGKYIPPDRTDGVPVWCQENDESITEETEDMITEDDITTTTAEIDLD